MEENFLRRIDNLTRLIEDHKNKAAKQFIAQENNLEKSKYEETKLHSKCVYVTPQTKRPNVHINPNFKTRNPVILINPKIPIKPVIHVNPKIMKSANLNLNLTINDLKNASTSNACPAALSNHNSTCKTLKQVFTSDQNISNTNAKSNVITMSMKKSVYVNPNLMKKLSSTGKTGAIIEKTVPPMSSVQNKSCVRSEHCTKTPNMVMLSRNKLVRIKCGSGVSPTTSSLGSCKMKTSFSTYHKLKSINKSSPIINIPKLTHRVRNLKPHSPNIRNKINKYRLDKTKALKVKQKKPGIMERTNKNAMELIKIGDITYKSTRNQLIRRSYSFKKKRLENQTRNDKFLIASNGKKLCRVKSGKDTAQRSIVSGKSAFKNSIRNKVKQKSIQILRNKMRKNNQPCLIFQKFGYCANEKNGSCHKLHDKKQISVCKKFLQGKCLLEQCLLSHDVGPEKMPTCKYFLEGCCMRDNCPYLHVKVSSKTPICLDFLKGYCAKGNECQKRHEKLCPEFQKTGKCIKGKNCPYPHKLSNLFAHELDNKYLGESHNTIGEVSKSNIGNYSTTCNQENVLRYYTKNDPIDFDEKETKIMENFQPVTELENDSSENEFDDDNRLFKRPPIGTLPAYIPIN